MRIPHRLFAPLLAGAAALQLAGCTMFSFGGMSSHECLTRAMYFESNRSSEDGMLAVGTVVMNRVAAKNEYPNDVCGVVGQPRQFADGVLSRKMTEPKSRARAEAVARRVLNGERHPSLNGAVHHFHTVGYTFPYDNMYYVLQAGGNIFYEKRRGGSYLPPPATLIASQQPRPLPPPPSGVASAWSSAYMPVQTLGAMPVAVPPAPLR